MTGSCYIYIYPWAGLKLVILLPHPPSTGIAGVYHHTCSALLVFNYFKNYLKLKIIQLLNNNLKNTNINY